jgi:cytochrome c
MPKAMTGQVCARRGRQTRNGVFAATMTFMLIISGLTTAHGVDVELGRYLSSECMTCHGTAKGQTRFAAAIKAYRDKALPNPVMQTIASRLSDDDIAALALYFQTAMKPK